MREPTKQELILNSLTFQTGELKKGQIKILEALEEVKKTRKATEFKFSGIDEEMANLYKLITAHIVEGAHEIKRELVREEEREKLEQKIDRIELQIKKLNKQVKKKLKEQINKKLAEELQVKEIQQRRPNLERTPFGKAVKEGREKIGKSFWRMAQDLELKSYELGEIEKKTVPVSEKYKNKIIKYFKTYGLDISDELTREASRTNESINLQDIDEGKKNILLLLSTAKAYNIKVDYETEDDVKITFNIEN